MKKKFKRPVVKSTTPPKIKAPIKPVSELPSYLYNRWISLIHKGIKTADELKSGLDAYNSYLDLLEQEFAALRLEPYEEHTLYETTTALGIIKPSHNYVHEVGDVTLVQPSAAWEKYVRSVYTYERFKTLTKHWDNDIWSDPTYPRGRNTGVPIVVTKANRLLNDIVLAANAAIAHAGWSLVRRGQDAKAVVEAIRQAIAEWFPAPVFLEFFRLQHTHKEMPLAVQTAGGASWTWFKSTNFEPRVRIVNATSKPISMISKFPVKYASIRDFSVPGNPFFATPDELERRYAIATNKGWVAVAFDQSKFDIHHGYLMLELILKHWARRYRELEGFDVYGVLTAEQELPAIVLIPEGYLVAEPWSSVRSGDSKTSRMDSLLNGCEVLAAADTVGMRWSQDFDFLIMGDDLIIFAPPERVDALLNAYRLIGNKLGLEVDKEEPTRFIGKYPMNRKVRVNRGSYLQSLFFPERRKHPLTLALGIMARLENIEKSGYDVEEFLAAVRRALPKAARLNPDHPVAMAYIQSSSKFGELTKHMISYSKFRTFCAQLVQNIQKYVPNAYQEIDEIIAFLSKGAHFDADIKVTLAGVPLSQVAEVTLDELWEDISRAIPKEKNLAMRQALTQIQHAIAIISKQSTVEGFRQAVSALYSTFWSRRGDIGLVGPKGPKNDFLMDRTSGIGAMRDRQRWLN